MESLPLPQPERAVLCAWCDGITAGPFLPPEQVSHGICPECLRRCTERKQGDLVPHEPAPPLPS